MENHHPQNDLNAGNNLKRIDDLESFRKEFEGKAFDQKVSASIGESICVQKEIKALIWDVIKSKILYILLTALVVIFFDVIKEVAVNISHQISSSNVQITPPQK